MHSIIKNRGFTLIETLTYGVGLIIILGGCVIFIVNLYDWYRSATIPTRTDEIGIALLTRISNDIRSSTSVNDSSSVYNNQNGVISVTSGSGALSTTTVYLLENGALKYRLNSNATTTASANDVYISGFYVRKLITPVSITVRTELDIDYHDKNGTTTNKYASLTVLRQSYQ